MPLWSQFFLGPLTVLWEGREVFCPHFTDGKKPRLTEGKGFAHGGTARMQQTQIRITTVDP